MNSETTAQWISNGKIDEVAFCEELLRRHDMVYCEGSFFTPQGIVTSEDQIRDLIFQMIRPYVRSQVTRRIEQLLGALRHMARGGLNHPQDYLHTANGTYEASTGKFLPVLLCCRHRLPVNYNPNAPKPVQWLRFLEELLEPEDVATLQEYMGYCLIPTTAAQKMLMIIGNGGEGKSRIGVVMRSLLGDNMNQSSIAKVETNAFARADLQHKLVMVDDDLKMEALPSTHYLKSIITAELPMDLERKGSQSFQGRLYVRFLAFGNGSLRSLHDRSFGFFRRQIILSAKPRPADRMDDPFLGTKLIGEKEGIFLWCLEGLERLVCNDFRFTTSLRANGTLFETMYESNNILQFMGSEGYFRYDAKGSISSRQLYNLYRDWCEDNASPLYSASTFWSYLYNNASDYGLRYSNNIPIGNGRKARGFFGIRGLPRM